RSEHWELDAPDVGTANVVVTLSGNGDNLSAIATTYSGCAGLGANTQTTGGNISAIEMSLTSSAATSLLDGNWAGATNRAVTPGSGVSLLEDVRTSGETDTDIVQWSGYKAATGGADTWAIATPTAVRSAGSLVEVLEAA